MVDLINSSVNVLAVSASLSFSFLPVGAICMWSHNDAPTNWVLCEGQAISRGDYSNLFDIIGTAFGMGDGSTTFNVPNFKKKHPLGAGTIALAGSGGSMGHNHSVDHNHTIPVHNHGNLVHFHASSHTHNYSHTHTVDDHNHTFEHGHDANHSHISSTTSGSNNLLAAGFFMGSTANLCADHTHTASFGVTNTRLANNTATSTSTKTPGVSDAITSQASELLSENQNAEIPDSTAVNTANNNVTLGNANLAYMVVKYIIKVK